MLTLTGGLTVALVLALVASEARVQADQAAGKARQGEADAVAARKEAEKANDNLVTTVARGLLRPLAVQVRSSQWFPGLSDPEIAALWEVGSLKDERLHFRFVEQALQDPVATRQLTDRAAFAFQAAVGLDGRRRTQVEKLLGKRLLAKETPEDQREDVAIRPGHLGILDRFLAERTVATLTRAISQTFEPHRLSQLSEGLFAVAARMEPKEAAAVLTLALSKPAAPGSAVKGQLAQSLSAVAARMDPKEAAATLTGVISKTGRRGALVGLCRAWRRWRPAWSRRRPTRRVARPPPTSTGL